MRALVLRLGLVGPLICAAVFAHAQPSSAPRAGEVSFVTGTVIARGGSERTLRVGDAVFQGETLTTGAGGHLHVKTVDKGFLALRPSSRARVEIYEFDPAAPPNTRIRLVLETGVMRAVSGEGAQAARERFRLNTPVAAIGIRGTDFTVSTTDTLTRAVVQKGAIVVSAFGAQCRPDALGPCEGGGARALTGEQAGKLLELRRGQPGPALIDVRPNGGSPDQIAPPAPAEPRAAAPSDRSSQIGQQAAALTNEAKIGGQLDVVAQTAEPPAASPPTTPAPNEPAPPVPPPGASPVVTPVVTPPVPPPQPAAAWGRWAYVAGLRAPVNIDLFVAQNGTVLAINSLYVLSASRREDLRVPESGQFDFRLSGSDAFVTNSGIAVAPATVNSGQLSVDFGQRSFATSLDVSALGVGYAPRANGRLTGIGQLSGSSLFVDRVTNMTVRGALGGGEGTSAAYLFDFPLGVGRSIVGATSWQR